MAIDEFGREIPTPGGSRPGFDRRLSRSRSRSRSRSPYAYRRRGGDERIGGEKGRRSRSRSGSPPYRRRRAASSRSRSRSPPTGPGGRGERRGASPPPSVSRELLSSRPIPRRARNSNYRSRSRSPLPGRSRSRSRSASPPYYGGGHQHHHHHHHHRHHRHRGDRGGRRSRSLSPEGLRGEDASPPHRSHRGGRDGSSSNEPYYRHPIERYVQEPMLCEFLWRRANPNPRSDERREGGPLADRRGPLADDAKDGEGPDNPQEPERENDSMAKDGREGADEGDDGPQKPAEDGNNESYASYVSQYCTDLIKCFFNAHLDDEWFKLRYSPLHRKRFALRERERARDEAQSILDEARERGGTEEDGDGGDGGASDFVRNARLGVGRRQSSASSAPTARQQQQQTNKSSDARQQPKSDGDRVPRKRKYRHEDDRHAPSAADEDRDGGEAMNPVPASHLLSSESDVSVKITGIQPQVTDEQLALALETLCSPGNKGGTGKGSERAVLRICSTTVGPSSSHVKYCSSLERTAWAVFASVGAKEQMLDTLVKVNDIEDPEDTKISVLELDVDCSDAYGRVEIDADGRGSAPAAPPGASDVDRHGENDDDGAPPKVPVRRCTVLVHPRSGGGGPTPRVAVLSAAVSSGERIPRDRAAALMIARALDTAAKIPAGTRLDDLLDVVFSGEGEGRDEDVLDVAIAYLRRVHLFAFYAGRASAREGDVLAGIPPAGTIHLRLADADAILKKAQDEVAGVKENGTEAAPGEGARDGGDPDVSSDLLVRRLDESIAKAMEESTARIASNDVIVDERVDELAVMAEKDEEGAKEDWLDSHTLLDADGRARCSFHFCKKLFKDKHYLQKHLLKKHPEYLAAEQASAHDKYMMQAWEAEEVRPLPKIVVDCGSRYGFVEVCVSGADPTAPDPEPALFERDEERRRRREEERRREVERRERERERRFAAEDRQGGQGLGMQQRGADKTGFVDVDDMKEEKVTLAYDKVEFPPPKKKRKKKKKNKLA